MKVVYLISRAKRTGPVNQALYILTGLSKQPGVEATLITLAPEVAETTQLERFKEKGIATIQLGQSLFNTWRCIKLLRRYVRENDVDIVHSSGFRANFVNMMLKGYAKTVSTQRCLPNETVEKFPKLIQPPFEKLYLTIIKKIDTIVTCSKALQKVYRAEYDIDAEAVQNGVNTDFFVPANSNRKKSLRDELGLPQDQIIYFSLGRLSTRKNVGLIIKAFLSFNEPNLCLLIAGSGPEKEYLEKLADGNNNIFFVGSVKNPLDYLQASDVLVSSALAEGLPNNVLEAMACGLPSILSDIEPHKELLDDNDLGLLFSNGSVEDLQKAIMQSISWDFEKKGNYIRQQTIEKHSIKTLSENYYQVYKRTLEKK